MKIIIALITMFFISNCKGQTYNKNHSKTLFSIKAKKDINTIFDEYNCDSSPGFCIGIIKDTSILYARGYGSANLDYKISITPHSSFDIASVSKQFTAACIALLIIEGRISLETPVSQFIPGISKYIDTIRIKHLIYNTSGLIDYYKLPRPDGKSWITFNYFDINYCTGYANHISNIRCNQ